MSDGSDPLVLGHVATWVLANATSFGVVYKWLTSPIDIKIANLVEKHKELTDRVRALESIFSPRSSLSDAPTLGEVTRRLEAVEEWQKEMERFRAEAITDEEFRSYVNLASSKIESILKHLGWIRGRLGDRPEEG